MGERGREDAERSSEAERRDRISRCSPLLSRRVLQAIDGLVVEAYDRAAPRGVGNIKCAGNYAPDVQPSSAAKVRLSLVLCHAGCILSFLSPYPPCPSILPPTPPSLLPPSSFCPPTLLLHPPSHFPPSFLPIPPPPSSLPLMRRSLLKHFVTAQAAGYPICLYLDAQENAYVEEFSTSNFIGIKQARRSREGWGRGGLRDKRERRLRSSIEGDGRKSRLERGGGVEEGRWAGRRWSRVLHVAPCTGRHARHT